MSTVAELTQSPPVANSTDTWSSAPFDSRLSLNTFKQVTHIFSDSIGEEQHQAPLWVTFFVISAPIFGLIYLLTLPTSLRTAEACCSSRTWERSDGAAAPATVPPRWQPHGVPAGGIEPRPRSILITGVSDNVIIQIMMTDVVGFSYSYSPTESDVFIYWSFSLLSCWFPYVHVFISLWLVFLTRALRTWT